MIKGEHNDGFSVLPDLEVDALGVRHEAVAGARLEAALGAHVLADVVVHDLDVVVEARQAHRHVRALIARVLPRGTLTRLAAGRRALLLHAAALRV